MSKQKKLAMAFILLGGGCAGAMLFGRPTPTPERPQPAPTVEQPLVLREQTGVPPAIGPQATLAPGQPPDPSTGAGPGLNRLLGKTASGPPPEMSARFDTAPPVTPFVPTPSPVLDQAADADVPFNLPSLADTIPQGDEPLRTHRIVDGDTLAGLAQRYLGDADRADEIAKLNTGIIANPELLPIGATLKIPHRQPSISTALNTSPQRNTESQRSPKSSSAEAPPAAGNLKLIPVPPGAAR